MTKSVFRDSLGARERQIMDAIYRLGEASVGEVLAELPDPPTYSAVRTMVRLLEGKGLLRHRQVGTKYVYRPAHSREAAKRSALKHLMQTFFGGSAADAVAALLDPAVAKLSDDDIQRLERLIQEARQEGN
jgi:predicted transcriptional regulator